METKNKLINKKDVIIYGDYIVEKNKFYVYVYLDPRYLGNYNYSEFDLNFDCKPIYIGKGKNERFLDHFLYVNEEKYPNNFFYNTLNKIKKFEIYKIIKILKFFNNESDAFEYEKKLIDNIGRKIINENYPLLNITAGGIGVLSSSVPKEIRKKLYGSPGEKNPAYRKDLDEKIEFIIEDYTVNKLTLKDLSNKYLADERVIKSRLLKKNIEVNNKNQYLKVSEYMKMNNPMKKKINIL